MGTEDNHYIPEFYLKAWTGGAPRWELHVYERPATAISRRRRTPGGTAWVRNLYTADLPTELEKYWIEDTFLKTVDNQASRAHKGLITGKLEEVRNSPLRTAWSRFIIATWNRNPEKVAWLKEEWQRHNIEALEKFRDTESEWAGKPGNPASLDEYVKSGKKAQDDIKAFVNLQQTVMDSKAIGEKLNQMHWAMVKILNVPDKFITGDRPIILAEALGSGYLVMPLSPNHLFIAYHKREQALQVQSWGGRPLVAKVNSQIVKQAKRFVFAADDHHATFIECRLGKYPDQVYLATHHKLPPGAEHRARVTPFIAASYQKPTEGRPSAALAPLPPSLELLSWAGERVQD